MELELLTWLVRRWMARPWLVLAWGLLVTLTGVLRTVSSVGVRTEPIAYQVVMSETILLWGLLGGLSILGAWAEIESSVAALSERRRWRVRGWLSLVLLWLPAIPILAIGTILTGGEGSGGALLVSLAVLAQLTLVAWLAERIPWPAVRSFVFVAFAWWLPALASSWSFGPFSWLQPFEAGRADSNSGLDSAVWQAWVGSMLALVFATLALDLVRRPHHEVRHPR